MFDKKRIRQDFSKAAKTYDAHAALQQSVLNKLVKKAESFLPSQGEALDAGCGTGQLISLLPNYNITGLDVAFSMCHAAAQRGAAVVNASIELLPFGNHVFDAVFCSLALQWVENQPHVLTELNRVLKPGGVLALSTFGEGTLRELKESFTAVDNYSHVSQFTPSVNFDETETVTEYFSDLKGVMRQLKAVGASNKLEKRGKSLMTPRQYDKIEQYYREQFAQENGLPVTWKILYSVKTKKREL